MMLICLIAAAAAMASLNPGTMAGPFADVFAPGKSRPEMFSLLAIPFDRPPEKSQVMRFLRTKALDDGGYTAIDEATRREAALLKVKDQQLSPQEQLLYHSLRARLRLMLSFGKVTAAKQMASPQNKSYAVQAMESGIDCMRDAAKELEEVEKRAPVVSGHPCPETTKTTKLVTSAQLWEFHRRLLGIWDTAKKRDDMNLIRNVDLKSLAKEVLGQP